MRNPGEWPGLEMNCERELLNTDQCGQAPIFLSNLIVEDWGYLIPHFLGFFILFRCSGLGWF
jgi:hypothetical protein